MMVTQPEALPWTLGSPNMMEKPPGSVLKDLKQLHIQEDTVGCSTGRERGCISLAGLVPSTAALPGNPLPRLRPLPRVQSVKIFKNPPHLPEGEREGCRICKIALPEFLNLQQTKGVLKPQFYFLAKKCLRRLKIAIHQERLESNRWQYFLV